MKKDILARRRKQGAYASPSLATAKAPPDLCEDGGRGVYQPISPTAAAGTGTRPDGSSAVSANVLGVPIARLHDPAARRCLGPVRFQ